MFGLGFRGAGKHTGDADALETRLPSARSARSLRRRLRSAFSPRLFFALATILALAVPGVALPRAMTQRAAAPAPSLARLDLPAQAPEPPSPPRLAAIPATAAGVVDVRRTYRLVWPATGEITSYFNTDHPLGIDIGLDLEADSPVLASASGIVTFAGGAACCSYGHYLVIDHEDGFATLYGHFESMAVEAGDRVTQGQLLGLGGSTGESDGKHLHFEVRAGDSVVDPLGYLPAEQAAKPEEQVDCSADRIFMEQRSRAELSWRTAAGTGYTIRSLELQPLAGRAIVEAEAEGSILVLRGTGTVMPGGAPLEHNLKVVLADGPEERSVECLVTVRQPAKSPPAPPRPKAPTATPTPSATSTPRPQPTQPVPRDTPTPQPPTPTWEAPGRPREPAPTATPPRGAPTAIPPTSTPQRIR